jgi:hypothetical protein
MKFQGRDGIRPTVLPVDLVDSDEKQSLGVFTAGWVWERASAQDPRDFYSILPFSGRFSFVVGHDQIFISEGTDLEIEVFDAQGRLARILRENALPLEVTEADREAYIEAQDAGPRPYRPDVPFPDRFGSYTQLILSHEGDLWARRSPRPTEEAQRWVVFSSDGRELRRLLLPDIRVESVRGDRIFGHRSDSLGIQTIVVLDGRS